MIVLLVLFSLVVGVEVARRLFTKDASYSDAIKGLQAVLTATAILMAGYWYFVDRKGKPHAEVSEQLNVVPIGIEGAVGIEATITVKNIGEQLLQVRGVDIRLQSATMDADTTKKMLGMGLNEWPSKWPSGEPLFNEAEYQWPTMRWFNAPISHDVEPGESDVITATFIVPCSAREVRVATSVEKGASGIWLWKGPTMNWKTRQFADTTVVCRNSEAKHEPVR